MFSHITVGTRDIARAKGFYDAVLRPLGLVCWFDDPDGGWLSYSAPAAPERPQVLERPQFLVCRPINGEAASAGNGTTIGFEARTRAQVDAFHAAALANGGTDEGAPGPRPHYHPGYYGAYVRDPDGNKLCCACHEAE
jgi:catechol 2,3-dioxygenase-like lactoylglutathione lyase family enzyme